MRQKRGEKVVKISSKDQDQETLKKMFHATCDARQYLQLGMSSDIVLLTLPPLDRPLLLVVSHTQTEES